MGRGQVAVMHAVHPSSPEHLEMNPGAPDDGPGARSDKFITHVLRTVSSSTDTRMQISHPHSLTTLWLR